MEAGIPFSAKHHTEQCRQRMYGQFERHNDPKWKKVLEERGKEGYVAPPRAEIDGEGVDVGEILPDVVEQAEASTPRPIWETDRSGVSTPRGPAPATPHGAPGTPSMAPTSPASIPDPDDFDDSRGMEVDGQERDEFADPPALTWMILTWAAWMRTMPMK